MAAPDGVWEAGWVSLEGSLTLPDPQLSDTEITLLAQCLAALEPLLPAQLQTVAVELRPALIRKPGGADCDLAKHSAATKRRRGESVGL